MATASSSSPESQLSSDIATALDAFHQCQNVANKNKFIRTKISEITTINGKFRELTEQSISQADYIALYTKQLAKYAKFVTNPGVTSQGSIQGARSLSRQTQKNKQLSANITKNYKKIIENLKNIRDALKDYEDVIEHTKHEVLIKEKEERELREVRDDIRAKKDENIQAVNKHSRILWLGYIPTTVASLIAPELAPALVTISAIAVDLATELIMEKLFDKKDWTLFGSQAKARVLMNSVLAVVKTCQERYNGVKIWHIKKGIEKARNQLDNSLDAINYLCGHVQSIIDNLSQFEDFWAVQETELEYIITILGADGHNEQAYVSFWVSLGNNLQHMSQIMTHDSETEIALSEFDAEYIQELCSGLEHKCREYSRVTRVILNRPVVSSDYRNSLEWTDDTVVVLSHDDLL